jgi:hypothetical protein
MKTIADCELRIANLQKKRPAPASIRNPQSAIRNGLFLAGLLVAAVALAAGCESAPAERQAIRLKPSAEARVFQVRAVLLQQRIRPDAPVEDLWRLLGTTGVPYEKRTLWELNDLRMGDGARLAADRLNELATETQDRTAQVGVQFAGENLDFVISLGATSWTSCGPMPRAGSPAATSTGPWLNSVSSAAATPRTPTMS